MAANAVIITKNVTVTWDGVPVKLLKGTVLDTPPASGSNLLQMIGASNYRTLTSQEQGNRAGIWQPLYTSMEGSEPYNPGQN